MAATSRTFDTPGPYATEVLIAAAGFSERVFSSNPSEQFGRNWGHYLSRRCRYDLFWAWYEQNIFRKLHLWAEAIKEDFDLYANIRSIVSPAHLIGDFWPEHIWSGSLDPECGDGTEVYSALPIETKNPDLRPVIAQILADSNWQVQKDITTLYGAVLGDVGLCVDDDRFRRRVSIRVVHPRDVRSYRHDKSRETTSYVLIKPMPDPEWEGREEDAPVVAYREFATLIRPSVPGGPAGVYYETFRDLEPYDWADYPPGEEPAPGEGVTSWTEYYGFVPFDMIQHRDVGMGWGWSAYQPSFPKLLEIDEIASSISDAIGRRSRSPKLIKGMTRQAFVQGFEAESDQDGSDNAFDDKNTLSYVFTANTQAGVDDLGPTLIVGESVAFLKFVIEQMGHDNPELDILAATTETAAATSGRALRVRRQVVEKRVRTRRSGYDAVLVRVVQKAIVIGALKKYPGFEKFAGVRYGDDRLTFAIGERPVFSTDDLDQLGEAGARADVFLKLRKAGMSTPLAMKKAGYNREDIAEQEASGVAEKPVGGPIPGGVAVGGGSNGQTADAAAGLEGL